jgi:hypothetical protein
LHRWGNFIAGYSIEFVEECLNGQLHGNNGEIVLDPFSGCGTTLLAARNMGFQTTGYELHPIFHSISKGKLGSYKLTDLITVRRALESSSTSIGWSEDATKFLEKMFTPSNLSTIAKTAEGLRHVESNLKDLAVTLFLKACEYSCGSQTDGVYKAPTSKKSHIP